MEINSDISSEKADQMVGKKRKRKDEGEYEPLWKTIEKNFQLRDNGETAVEGSKMPRKLTKPISPNLQTMKRVKFQNGFDYEMTNEVTNDDQGGFKARPLKKGILERAQSLPSSSLLKK